MPHVMPSARDYAKINNPSLPESSLVQLDKLDVGLTEFAYSLMVNAYFRATQNSRKAMSFGNPYDWLDDDRESIAAGLAELVLRPGLKLTDGTTVPYKSDDPRFIAEKDRLTDDILSLFQPNFRYEDMDFELKNGNQLLVSFLARKTVPIKGESLSDALYKDAKPAKQRRLSPLIHPMTAVSQQLAVPRSELVDKAFIEYRTRLFERAANATLAFAKSLAEQIYTNLPPQQREAMEEALVKRAAAKKSNPKSELYFSDGTAATITEILTRKNPALTKRLEGVLPS